jgi:hypothetical protein
MRDDTRSSRLRTRKDARTLRGNLRNARGKERGIHFSPLKVQFKQKFGI